ncbi:hypothetical protein BWH99_RS10300 [Vibrio parahaemolyticus]|nr:hypothetical protein [Vibrio parahaemolyticus]EIA9325461.1 hypothetical protein [Vibrio parahaemolyticus]EJG1681323.1 hypothetical protein [Vibrio parahaemolyticus]
MKVILISSLIALSFNTSAAVTIHEAVSFSNSSDKGVVADSAEIVNARGRNMPLDVALEQIAPMMQISFTNPNLKDMGINWRADTEHFTNVLSRISRQYPIDFVVNESAETIYVDVDKGQCTAHRELKLNEMANAWHELNISDQPILPPVLSVQADLAGYLYRYC